MFHWLSHLVIFSFSTCVSAHKLQAISNWLDGRSDATIYDYIYYVNAGKSTISRMVKIWSMVHWVCFMNIWSTRETYFKVFMYFSCTSRCRVEPVWGWHTGVSPEDPSYCKKPLQQYIMIVHTCTHQ